jgi:hypothetical protein
VQDLLETKDAENEHVADYISFGDYLRGVRVTRYCAELTTEEARDVVRGLDDGGFEREQAYADSISDHPHSTFEFFFSVPDLVGTAALWIDPYLPHGEAVCITC